MIGEAIPLVLIPRFTTYAASENTFTTAPLLVSDYACAYVTLWRGPLSGHGDALGFSATFQLSHDAEHWDDVDSIGTITTVDRQDDYAIDLTKRWFRIKVELTQVIGLSGAQPRDVSITCWATGLLELRIAD